MDRAGRKFLRKSSLAIVLTLAAGSLPLQAGAADIDKGRQKAEQICAACHGKDGNTPIDPSYPKLAGQHRDFLLRALMDYKSESRKNGIMVAQSQTLSKQDMQNLAAYYASLPGTMSHQR